eukprot:CAMPEP_0206547376 /NCGR_PEP_ID=MMETSP0325_2-20121206/13259_1 /ASSEMBLY_ACC=CAM_ASM_000347 /TAXON_ID=2866 /ORGANISM="Crypthecodinium cohnii, Strain Seligo" /LENGTH=490 /DNA_ID=CAMNT_0054046669 /DNA_START=22 /DNA_END=1496 /DNA_ORIENTATION=-
MDDDDMLVPTTATPTPLAPAARTSASASAPAAAAAAAATPATSSSTPPVTSGLADADMASKDPLQSIPRKPIVILMIGMAGSGKTTWMNRMVFRLQAQKKRVYTVNLDPAVRNISYPVNIDIRDTVNYKEVMKHFGLGPNGGIMTSLNLFATKFDQVLTLIDKRAAELDYILIDTPGQIEVFNWSASGQIILDALAVSYTTMVCYVTDAARCSKPVTFMSNMLYACSILYKTKLPFVIAFNKIDVMAADFLQEWMQDFTKIGSALSRESSYVASLAKSMSLAMEEFYQNIRSVGVSAVTGQGCEDFEKAVAEAAAEFHEQYVPFLLEQRRDIEEKRQRAIEEQVQAFEKSTARTKPQKRMREARLGQGGGGDDDDDEDMDDLQADIRDILSTRDEDASSQKQPFFHKLLQLPLSSILLPLPPSPQAASSNMTMASSELDFDVAGDVADDLVVDGDGWLASSTLQAAAAAAAVAVGVFCACVCVCVRSQAG